MNFASFDLNLLRVLDALLETGSTTESGDRIGLSQPAVSAALGRLRQALDDPLFVRQGRRMVPTDFARSLRDPLRKLLDETQALLSGPQVFDPMRTTASFKISGSDFFADLLMPKLAERMLRLAPGIVVQMVDLVPDSYAAIIDRHQADLALIPRMPVPDWILQESLFHSSFVTIARKGHPRLCRILPGDVIPIDLFCDLGHVLFSPEGNLTAMGDKALAQVGRARRIMMTMPVFSGVYTAVAQSDLIALIPKQLALEKAEMFGLDLYQPPMPVTRAEITMVWHRRADRNPALLWLRQQISELMAPLDEGLSPDARIV
ncbi:LysR family transcriptional regulator [Primorskyibacter sp. 2E233]|uniref:LysR family transcriptional regulator n=1 Tax=Primorskyibacter sp. 2E233 TaxID=3413431 RepID=UPI003BF2DFCF